MSKGKELPKPKSPADMALSSAPSAGETIDKNLLTPYENIGSKMYGQLKAIYYKNCATMSPTEAIAKAVQQLTP